MPLPPGLHAIRIAPREFEITRVTHYIAGLHAVTQLSDHFAACGSPCIRGGDRSCSPVTEFARADHHERQQHEQSKPIERSAAADAATAIRDHPHIGLSFVDI